MFVSPLPPVDVPAVSLYGFLFANLTPTDSERIALIDPSTGTEITFAELAANIDAFAGALAARGVTTSTVIGLLCPNTTGFVTASHGALRAGATVTTINATYTEREITDGQEVPKAFVVRTAESALTADDVMAFVAANVAPHKKVRAVEFIDAVPKSSAGKILRKDLRAQDANR